MLLLNYPYTNYLINYDENLHIALYVFTTKIHSYITIGGGSVG